VGKVGVIGTVKEVNGNDSPMWMVGSARWGAVQVQSSCGPIA
jgi:hypothetical protein